MHTRLLSIFFSAILLLSSGAVQLGVHLCSKSGPSFFSSCETNHHSVPDCCAKTKKQKQQSSPCCQDAYLFAITPKFGSIEQIALPDPGMLNLPAIFTTIEVDQFDSFEQTEHPQHSPPLPYNRAVQRQYCVWNI